MYISKEALRPFSLSPFVLFTVPNKCLLFCTDGQMDKWGENSNVSQSVTKNTMYKVWGESIQWLYDKNRTLGTTTSRVTRTALLLSVHSNLKFHAIFFIELHHRLYDNFQALLVEEGLRCPSVHYFNSFYLCEWAVTGVEPWTFCKLFISDVLLISQYLILICISAFTLITLYYNLYFI